MMKNKIALYSLATILGVFILRFIVPSKELPSVVPKRSISNTEWNIPTQRVDDDSQRLSLVKASTTSITQAAQNHIFIAAEPHARLGNQMFDFATSMGIADTLDYTFRMRSPHPLLALFEINQPLATKLHVDNLLEITLEQWRNETWRNEGTYLSFNLTLGQYFRVWRYFENVANEVRKSFTIKHRFLEKAENFLKLNTPKNSNLIGIHVRRGDFLKRHVQKSGKLPADKEYIVKAMNYFLKMYNDTFFVIVSNDKQWCKDNLAGTNVIISDFGEAILDMALLTLCNHTIMTSGTFGWWGGWLSGGTVVYWKGFPTAGSWHEQHIIFRGEFHPPHWVGID